jgi:hypothetical protein
VSLSDQIIANGETLRLFAACRPRERRRRRNQLESAGGERHAEHKEGSDSAAETLHLSSNTLMLAAATAPNGEVVLANFRSTKNREVPVSLRGRLADFVRTPILSWIARAATPMRACVLRLLLLLAVTAGRMQTVRRPPLLDDGLLKLDIAAHLLSNLMMLY